MAQRRRVIAGVVGVAVVAVLVLWVADAERRADWPSAARELARAIDDANALDARRQRLAAAKLVGEYATAARWAEYERYAAAEGMAEPLVEVGDFRVTAYLVPRDGGPSDVTGYPLHHGVVATDPAVIPTGALIYIPALREFDRLYAPVYRIPLRELKKRKDKTPPAPAASEGVLASTAAAPDATGGGSSDDGMGAEVEGGYAVSYEARGGGWFVARDTGAAVRGRVVDVAVFSDDAYRYVTARFPRERDEKTGKLRDVVKVYRMRYAKEWTRGVTAEGDR